MTTAITRPAFASSSRLRQRPAPEIDWPRVMRAATCFGVDTFRPGQRELIEAVLQGRDALGVLPIGGGKSLCYQLPALFLPRATVIVTPLLALAGDQVDHLTKWRLESSRLDSASSTPATHDNEHGISPVIYVTPERLQAESCISLLQLNGVSRLVIDEAHCASDRGHDFRPAYLAIARVAERLGNPPILATTTTATAETARDVAEQLGMHDPVIMRPGLGRPNLSFEVIRTVNEDRKREALLSILERHDGAGIIYCATIAIAEEVHAWLTVVSPGLRLGLHHGQLRSSQREETREGFERGDLRVVVATRAFGPGIDKRDVRFVVHWTFPDSLETYSEEAGRAGRDGEAAAAYLLYRREDRRIQQYFLGAKYPLPEECQRLCLAIGTRAARAVRAGERTHWKLTDLATTTNIPERRLRVVLSHLEREGVATVDDDQIVFDAHVRTLGVATGALIARYAARRRSDRTRLSAITQYGQSTDCRAARVLRYFGEDPAEHCGHCDTCRTRGAS